MMKKQNKRTIALIVGVFTFLLVGAAVYDALESEHEVDDLRELDLRQKNFIEKYNISETDYEQMKATVKKLIPHNARQWKFAGAFYYCVTVVTSIGYGHSIPRTIGGKAFTVFYAFVGIPFGLVMLQSMGERLNFFATVLLGKCLGLEHSKVSQTNIIVIEFTLAMMVVFISAAVFNHYEHWGYWNAVYYCIITLTTVGFGDYVPLQSKESDHDPAYVVFTFFFILFGLTVVSANMNLLVLRFMTANTDDERRDQAEAAMAAVLAFEIDGDVIQQNMTEHDNNNGGDKATTVPRRSNQLRVNFKDDTSSSSSLSTAPTQRQQPAVAEAKNDDDDDDDDVDDDSTKSQLSLLIVDQSEK